MDNHFATDPAFLTALGILADLNKGGGPLARQIGKPPHKDSERLRPVGLDRRVDGTPCLRLYLVGSGRKPSR